MWWLQCAVMMLFHPKEMVTLIKRRRKHIPVGAMLIPLLLCAAVRILAVYGVNYTVSSVSPGNINLPLELAFILLPVLLWSVACYGFMTIMGGESTFTETLTLSVFSMMPYIVLQPVMTAVSRVLSYSESGFYNAAEIFMFGWVIVLLFLTFMESNNIGFGKAVFFSLLIIVTMFLILCVTLLAFALDSQIVLFVQEIISELNFFMR